MKPNSRFKTSCHPGSVDFDVAPFLTIWEVTQACELTCKHCRAEAINQRHPDELSLEEGKGLIDQIADMGTPIVIFSGGNPLQREDLGDLVRHAKERGLRAGTIPAATDRLTRERVKELADAGLDQLAVSIDAPTENRHDNFRGVPGSFSKSMDTAQYAREVGLPLQVNTVFANWNVDVFDDMKNLVEELGVVFWEVFFLVPTGRGAEMEGLTADQVESLFGQIHTAARRCDYIIKVTEAQHYRRFVCQQERATGKTAGHSARHQLHRASGPGGSVGMAPKGVNSGKGFCFVDHRGDVFPSGFLPIKVGNIREQSLADLYRDSPLFHELRDPNLLKGRCGICDYKDLCGGSRARAYALTRDYLAADPWCVYEPEAPA